MAVKEYHISSSAVPEQAAIDCVPPIVLPVEDVVHVVDELTVKPIMSAHKLFIGGVVNETAATQLL